MTVAEPSTASYIDAVAYRDADAYARINLRQAQAMLLLQQSSTPSFVHTPERWSNLRDWLSRTNDKTNSASLLTQASPELWKTIVAALPSRVFRSAGRPSSSRTAAAPDLTGSVVEKGFRPETWRELNERRHVLLDLEEAGSILPHQAEELERLQVMAAEFLSLYRIRSIRWLEELAPATIAQELIEWF